MRKIILIIVLLALIFVSGCVQEKECEAKEDCSDRTCFTKDCIDYNCSYSQITPCCGNGICEPGETYKECADDCEKTGNFEESEVWGGEILITGDVSIARDLTILPGTVVKFAVQDDQQDGWETPADGYNALDPTRLISYGKTHSSLMVEGKLTAAGTLNNKILFTSAAENPKIADWEAIYPQDDGSLIEYSIIEWSRNGISAGLDTPNSIFRNNIIRYTMWGSIGCGWSGSQIYNNEIYECGHVGIDVQGGDPIIEDNTIYDCHSGIAVLRGSAVIRNNVMTNVGDGIHVGGDATPVLEDNQVEAAPPGSTKEWCYGSFCYLMFGDPVGTPILTEVYSVDEQPRYAVPAYRIESQNYIVELPFEADEWLFYGWKNDKWNRIEAEILGDTVEFPSEYSMYVSIPNPTTDEKDAAKFNEQHADIYRIMAV